MSGKEIVVAFLVHGGTPAEVAKRLRAIADRVEAGELFEEVDGHRVMVRRGGNGDAGEETFDGRYYAVGYDGEYSFDPAALFRYKHHAEAFANGATYEYDEDRPSHGGIITRADIVGLGWNCIDDDPAVRAAR